MKQPKSLDHTEVLPDFLYSNCVGINYICAPSSVMERAEGKKKSEKEKIGLEVFQK